MQAVLSENIWQNLSRLIPEWDFDAVFLGPWRDDPVGSAWVVGTGILVALGCGLVGTFLLLRRQALVGDAMSHSVLPGLVLAYLIAQSRDGWVMFLGALVAGVLTMVLIEGISARSRIRSDAAIGIVFSAMFAFGILLVTRFAAQVDIDADCVLYGEIDHVVYTPVLYGMHRPFFWMGVVTLLELALLGLFYRHLLVCCFDAGLARSLGLHPGRVGKGLILVLALVVVTAFEAVGAILVVGMLILPGATGLLMARRLPSVLAVGAVHSVGSSVFGFHLAHWLNCSTGAAMIVAGCAIFFIAWMFHHPEGLIWRMLSRRRHALEGPLEANSEHTTP